MTELSDNVGELSSSILALISKNQQKLNNVFERRIKHFTLAIENQERLFGILDTASDIVQENLDKMRFESKNLRYKCEVLSKQVKETEERNRKILAKSSQRDLEQKSRLTNLRTELQLYECILNIGIEDLGDGKVRGVLFKNKGFAYCDLEGIDKLGENKENICESLQRFSQLNSIYSQLEVSEHWKPFL